jgi:adenosylmethionine-8-amino-7-oxononanoate aminotransferase
MDNSKLPSFGKSDKQMADAFGMSVSDFKKVKKQIVSDMTKPKVTAKVTAKTNAKPKPKPKTEAQRQAKAMDDLMKKRKAVAKKTGTWPNYGTN